MQRTHPREKEDSPREKKGFCQPHILSGVLEKGGLSLSFSARQVRGHKVKKKKVNSCNMVGEAQNSKTYTENSDAVT